VFTLVPILFAAGVITILLPCILPLIPIVLGTSIAGRSKLRPFMVILGMLFSFVVFTFLLTVVLGSFPKAANYIRIGTYYVLLLFGVGFITHNVWLQYGVAIAGALFFFPDASAMVITAVLGTVAMHVGGTLASRLQNIGSNFQQQTQSSLGTDHPLSALLTGSTLGLVWVPCAGPALSFVFTLLHERPGTEAILLLFAYGLGTAIPLLLIGYGGQHAVYSVRFLSRYSGRIKQTAGALLIFSALALQFHWFLGIETWLVLNTSYGTLGTRIEEQFFGDVVQEARDNL
jgi:cytochrome c-type biogenesis protein